jgi:diadenosine tetraphosphate (Ap4A) HIT family hydrolase
MPRSRWEAMVRGEDCPLCADIASKEFVNEHGYTVAELGRSRLRLAANQWVPGYSVLISTLHVCEPYELEDVDRMVFFDDMMRAGRALEQVFTPIKLNFQLLGNAVPHLHCHITPRYYGDPAPHRPLDPNLIHRHVSSGEAIERIAALHSALGLSDE